MSFAKVKIFPPSTAEKNAESLVSITDRKGLFSFIPDEEGEWRVSAEDGLGHQGSITVYTGLTAGALPAAPAVSPGSYRGRLPLPVGIILGLSLILNIFALWYIMGKGKKGGVHAHQ
jgi:hypothetical protein